jgi:hypothetical protein
MLARADDPAGAAGGIAAASAAARRLSPVLAWAVCILRHRAAHRWYPRYLDGYGVCSTCGRGWPRGARHGGAGRRRHRPAARRAPAGPRPSVHDLRPAVPFLRLCPVLFGCLPLEGVPRASEDRHRVRRAAGAPVPGVRPDVRTWQAGPLLLARMQAASGQAAPERTRRADTRERGARQARRTLVPRSGGHRDSAGHARLAWLHARHRRLLPMYERTGIPRYGAHSSKHGKTDAAPTCILDSTIATYVLSVLVGRPGAARASRRRGKADDGARHPAQ